ncbi:hypothetical protein [Pseudoalteromonas piscicida]|uniref:hypothetical protein n=1 Tax=Pseudoalteromonas piscicida TaxID=43662 RepID=UPI0030B593A5
MITIQKSWRDLWTLDQQSFFNYINREGDFASYNGGLLDGMVQLSVAGKGWQNKDDDRFNLFFHFLAHEAAHFWNSDLLTLNDNRHAWLHEGSADAFAYFAMLDFELIDQAQWFNLFEDAANHCILNKGRHALQDMQRWQYKNHYACGAVIALASHLHVQANNPALSLFDIWQQLFKHSKNHTYGPEDYFSTLDTLTGETKFANTLRRFVETKGLNNYSEIMTWFNATAIRVMPSSDYSQFYIRHWGKQVVSELMLSHCKQISFNTYDDYIKTYPIDNCKAFEQEMEIHFINGIDLLRSGVAAYQAFKNKCAAGEQVILENRTGRPVARIDCIKQVIAPDPYIKLNPTDVFKN